MRQFVAAPYVVADGLTTRNDGFSGAEPARYAGLAFSAISAARRRSRSAARLTKYRTRSIMSGSPARSPLGRDLSPGQRIRPELIPLLKTMCPLQSAHTMARNLRRQIATWPRTLDIRCAAKMARLSSPARSTHVHERPSEDLAEQVKQAWPPSSTRSARPARLLRARRLQRPPPRPRADAPIQHRPLTTLPPDECGRTRRAPARRARSRSTR